MKRWSLCRELISGKIDAAVFLTGVGAQVVLRVAESANQREIYLDALKKIPVVARGPKPVSVLRPLGVPIALTALEPNTWRELLQALDANVAIVPLRDKVIAVQEYGATNDELLRHYANAERGSEGFRSTTGNCRKMWVRCEMPCNCLCSAKSTWCSSLLPCRCGT